MPGTLNAEMVHNLENHPTAPSFDSKVSSVSVEVTKNVGEKLASEDPEVTALKETNRKQEEINQNLLAVIRDLEARLALLEAKDLPPQDASSEPNTVPALSVDDETTGANNEVTFDDPFADTTTKDADQTILKAKDLGEKPLDTAANADEPPTETETAAKTDQEEMEELLNEYGQLLSPWDVGWLTAKKNGKSNEFMAEQKLIRSGEKTKSDFYEIPTTAETNEAKAERFAEQIKIAQEYVNVLIAIHTKTSDPKLSDELALYMGILSDRQMHIFSKEIEGDVNSVEYETKLAELNKSLNDEALAIADRAFMDSQLPDDQKASHPPAKRLIGSGANPNLRELSDRIRKQKEERDKNSATTSKPEIDYSDIPTEDEINAAAAAYEAGLSDADDIEDDDRSNQDLGVHLEDEIDIKDKKHIEPNEEEEEEDDEIKNSAANKRWDADKDYIDRHPKARIGQKIRAAFSPAEAAKIANNLRKKTETARRNAGKNELRKNGIDPKLFDALAFPAQNLTPEVAVKLLAIAKYLETIKLKADTAKGLVEHVKSRLEGLKLKLPKNPALKEVFRRTQDGLAKIDPDVLGTYLDEVADDLIDQIIARKTTNFFDEQAKAAQENASLSTEDLADFKELAEIDTYLKQANNPEKAFNLPEGKAILTAAYHFGLELLNDADREELLDEADFGDEGFVPLVEKYEPTQDLSITASSTEFAQRKAEREEIIENNNAYAYLDKLRQLKDEMPIVVKQYFVDNVSKVQPLLFTLKDVPDHDDHHDENHHDDDEDEGDH